MSESKENDKTVPCLPARLLKILQPTEEEKAFRLKLYPDVAEVENAKILCTICQKDVKHVFLLKKKTYKHIFLQVAVCKRCMKFYDDGDFSLDEDGDDKYCRWCGQGGTMCLCTNCPSTFCKKCIRTNLERKYQLMVDRDDWNCFFCDPKPLYKMRALSWALDEHLANIKKKEEAQKQAAAKRTPGTSKARRSIVLIEKPEYPSFDLDQMNVDAHLETLSYWMKDMCRMVNPVETQSTVRWTHCFDTVRNVKTPQDFVNAKNALEAFLEHEINLLVDSRKQFIEGLSRFKVKCSKSSQAEKEPVKVNGVDGNHFNGDIEPKVVENPKARARRKALQSISDEEDNFMNNTTIQVSKSSDVVEPKDTNSGLDNTAANDSLADIFDSSTVVEDINKDETNHSGVSVDEHHETKKTEENDEPRPLIRLRNLSDLMDPKLNKSKSSDRIPNPQAGNKSTPSDASMSNSQTGSKHKSPRKKSVELITLSSDESDVSTRSKTPPLKISEIKSLAVPNNSDCIKKSQKKNLRKNILDSDDETPNKIAEQETNAKSDIASNSDKQLPVRQAKLFSSSESEGDEKESRDTKNKGKAADNLAQSVNEEEILAKGKAVSEKEKQSEGDEVSNNSKNKGNAADDVAQPNSDEEEPVKGKATKITKQGVSSKTIVASSSDDEPQIRQAKLSTSSESEGDEKESRDTKNKGKAADDLAQPVNEEENPAKGKAVSEKVEESSSKDNEANNSNSGDSSDPTSSSDDPLSDSSGSKKKKAIPKKVNRSYFSSTDSGSEDSTRKVNKKSQKKQKKITLDSSDSDSDVDRKILFKKKTKAAVNSLKNKKAQNESPKSKSRKTVEDSDDDSIDMDIEKLCDLKSLQSKRIRWSSQSSDMSSGEDLKEKKKASKKAKLEGDKLSDFYDSDDDEQREGGDINEEEDMNETFRREFPQYHSDAVIDEDIKTSILNLSSSGEADQPVSSEEDTSSKKKGSKAHKQTLNREKTKGKKRYFDKLMTMNIDSDSDDMEKGQQKYQKLKEKRAEKSDKESEDEDAPVVKKKVVAQKKGKPRKKMFSDSDESPIENDSEENKSDKESSEEEEKEKKKRPRRSASGSDSSEDQPKKAAKKRRRIKTGSDSSSGSDTEGGGKKDKSLIDSASKGRKSIRRILKEDDLKQTTQAALKSEQERKKRIAEKQKLYNSMVEKTSEEPKELTELVLDFNPKTKEKIVVVDPTLVKKLKPHQAEGIKFMWDSCFETLEMAKTKSGSGCILAHCMGLGKSLQVVTLIHTLLTHPEIGVKTILVVAPVSTVLNWANEFEKWLKDVGSGQDVNVFHMTRCQANHRSFLLNDWARQGGVLIMGYNLLRTISNPKARVKAAFKKVFQEKLVDPGPDVVVCDEGHILKNEKTAISITMSRMKTRRRIVLTGTPLQNNLVEYHCMVQFVKPNLLGTKKEFTNRFVNPIQNGQFEDSTQHDVKIMKRRAHVLHTMLDGLVQRKDYSVLTPYLPPKFEYVIHLKLSDVQVKLYRYYLLNKVHGGDGEADGTAPKGKRLFLDFQNLMWICLHPRTLLMKSEKDEKKAEMEFDSDEDEEGSLKEFIDDGNDSSSSSEGFKTSSSSSDDNGSGSDKQKSKPVRRRTRGQGSVSDPEEEPAAPTKQWWSDLIEEEQMDDIRQSSKIFLFFTILKYCEEIGDKLLVFSQSLYTLDLLEYFLDKIDEESQKPEEERIPGIKGFEGSWAKGLDYFRLDGSSACENRESWCKSFNRKDNIRSRLFLISTRAGGLGINLTGANRVIIFDASWNPSFDVQSLFRVYRFGQDKPCYIYRFLSKGTMEEKIYERQVAKLSTALRVIDEQQIDRHFSHSALAELYMFDPEGSELQGTPVLPKDRLMAELLQNHSDIILSHHQHDSLLENQEDQELTEEERKAAWTEFENEKNQKPPVFQNTNMMGTLVTMMMDIRTKLKIQNPGWSEEQLRVGALQILQQYPDFKTMAPYLMLLQQQQMQQQQQQQHFQLQQQPRPGLPTVANPQFSGMTFPTFQYPLYTSNQPQLNNFSQLNNLTAGRVNNVAPPFKNMAPVNNAAQQFKNVPPTNNVGLVQNAMLEQLLKQNTATNLNSLLVNPKHSTLNSQPKIQTVRSLQKVQPPSEASKSTGAGTSTETIELDDSIETTE